MEGQASEGFWLLFGSQASLALAGHRGSSGSPEWSFSRQPNRQAQLAQPRGFWDTGLDSHLGSALLHLPLRPQ